MPNPLLRRQANTSTVDVDRPVAETPVPERVQGHVFPYRGMETHGVDPNNDTHDVENYGWMEEARGVVVEYEPEEAPHDPIPVYIVQRGGRELKRWRAVRQPSGTINDQPSNVLGADPYRRKVTIKNTSADLVYIGQDAVTASAMHGYPLAQNESMVIETTRQIFAVSSTANICTLAMLVEYVTVDDGRGD